MCDSCLSSLPNSLQHTASSEVFTRLGWSHVRVNKGMNTGSQDQRDSQKNIGSVLLGFTCENPEHECIQRVSVSTTPDFMGLRKSRSQKNLIQPIATKLFDLLLEIKWLRMAYHSKLNNLENLRNIVFSFCYQVSTFRMCYAQYVALCLQCWPSKPVYFESYQNLAVQVLILLSATVVFLILNILIHFRVTYGGILFDFHQQGDLYSNLSEVYSSRNITKHHVTQNCLFFHLFPYSSNKAFINCT
jgi:hypothetical protein